MDPPVTVIGRRQFRSDPPGHLTASQRTFLVVPGTSRYIQYVGDRTTDHSVALAPVDFRTIVLPLSLVRDILDRELAVWEKGRGSIWATENPWRSYVAALKAWRVDLTRKQEKASEVLHKVKKTIAAKRILNQFRQAIGNPAYRMCRKRLGREFESLVGRGAL
jgi:hypothetical protein